MKKGASESNVRRTQREVVRRSQAASRQRAREQAAREQGEQQSRAVTRQPPGVAPKRGASPTDLVAQQEVAVPISRRARYGFVAALAFIAVAAIVIVGARNAPAWLSAFSAAGGAQAGAGAQAQSSATGGAVSESIDIGKRIGIVSGHRGNDSGAVCADGLTEAQVNFDHATRIASFLRAEGYTVDILDEFDSRLKGYRARALLSIHADSCAYINELATGFKVARVLDSQVPVEEDKLVACITSRYKRATGLRFHANTITYDMTKYHAFYEIDQSTPAAIIETGFMYLDRPLLTRRPEVVARGITDGLRCYLEGDAP